jgi:uncharacterized protein with von Willebrand factor type A (vWA) domain
MINLFDADLGGTDITPPLKVVINQLSKNAPQTRIFLLTDGEEDDINVVI